jgi:hypothetical protein
MKFALSALCAIVLLAGATGCKSCCCRWSHDRTCTAGGCGPRYRFRPYEHCDTCDQCGNWTGSPIVSGSQRYPKVGYAEDYGMNSQVDGGSLADGGHNGRGDDIETARGYRVVPGSDRVIKRSGRPTLARASGQPTPAMMADESVEDDRQVAPARIKSKRVARARTARPRQIQEED